MKDPACTKEALQAAHVPSEQIEGVMKAVAAGVDLSTIIGLLIKYGPMVLNVLQAVLDAINRQQEEPRRAATPPPAPKK